MFTGIIEKVGTVKAVRRGSGEAKLVISCRTVLGKKLSMGRANTIESQGWLMINEKIMEFYQN